MPGGALQLALDLVRAPTLDFDSYLPGPNGEAVQALEAWSRGEGAAVLWLAGAPATGKSHLLQAAVRAAGTRAMYLPLAELRTLAAPSVLEDLHTLDAVALDDVAACRGDTAWERALFRLYNELRAAGGRLLWAAPTAPAGCAFALPDLASRAAASLVYPLRGLADADKAAALAAAARRRGLDLAPAVIDFILRRERRDMAALGACLDRLDRASLAEGRAPTLAFVRALLAAD